MDELYTALKVSLYSCYYDVVYVSIGHCMPFCGLMRQIGILRAKLVVVAHHPPFKMLKYGKYDAVIFFSESLRKRAIQYYPNLAEAAYVNQWGPDMPWYKKYGLSISQENLFIENGKSNRDFVLLRNAAKKLKMEIFDYKSLKKELDNNFESDIDAVGRTSSYKYIVIAVMKRTQKYDVVCGLTSFMDALGLCKPVLVSDNVCFASDVISYNLGTTYETGSIESICRKIQMLTNNQSIYRQYQERIKKYVLRVNMAEYSKKLQNIFDDIGVI